MTIFGKTVVGWHRTDTSSAGQLWVGERCYTDVAIKFEDGSKEYAVIVSERAL